MRGTIDQPLELNDVGGLHQIMIETRTDRALAVFLLTVAGQANDQRAREGWGFTKLARNFKTVHAGQSDVEHDDVRPVRPGLFERLGSIMRK